MAARTYTWNWSAVTGSKADSSRIRQASTTLTSRATPARGSWDVEQLNSIHTETLNDVKGLFSQWNTVIQPILKSLPAGSADSRWGGMRSEIDALTYGIDGTTLFVLQDASPSNFDGRYWHPDNRPFTIAEVIEDHDGRIGDLESAGSSSSSSLFDDTDLWDAVGWGLKPGSTLTSASSSLDGRATVLEADLEKVAKDVYGVSDNDPGWASYLTTWNGPVFKYGIYEYLHYITDLHGVSMLASEDPWDVAHADLGVHTHPQSEVDTSLYSTKDRAFGLPTTLEHDLERVRYEVGFTRGTTWNTGSLDGPFATGSPISANHQGLFNHINYTGAGTASGSNPHGLDYTDTGADTIFNYVKQFVGQATITDVDPAYSSTNYVTQGADLTQTIGELDSALATAIVSTVTRVDFFSNRNIYTEEWRMTNPVVCNHNLGEKPQVDVLDLTPEDEDTYGQYVSETRSVNVVHVDDNQIEVWTGAADIQVICIG